MDWNGDGTPDFWNKGGNGAGIPVSTTSLYLSPARSIQLNDTSATTYGEWYSDLKAITGGVNYQLRYNLRYTVPNAGTMRVTVNFYNAAGSVLSSTNFPFTGTHNYWEEFTRTFTAPQAATTLNVTFASGGALDATGQAWLDDVSLAPTASATSKIPYIENFPKLPSPLVIRNWKQAATDYHTLAFNPAASGQYLPLLYEYNVTTAAGFSGAAFGLPSYVGNPRDGGEALSALGAVLGGTLSGLNMATLNGKDRVQQCEAFYSTVNGRGLVLNNVNSPGSGSAWYDIFPSTLFYEIGSRYPGRASYQAKMRAIADSWLTALPVLDNNWEHTGFNFTTMTPTDNAWIEPDMAVGIAWLEYMAHVQFGDSKYLAGADKCMQQMNNRSMNPVYEVLGYYGPTLAARMNAELGRNYSTAKHLDWVFAATSDARPGWGCEAARWGSYDAFGLMGSTTDSNGYAFSMNTYAAAGILTPLVRYEPGYARLLGRWLLHVAANSNLFHPATLPSNMQSSPTWVQQTGIGTIPYEGVRNNGATTPFATGDATEPVQDLNPYGAWGSGVMAALFQGTNMTGILKIDCVATEAFPPATFPTYLYYNPYATVRQPAVNAGSTRVHLYDATKGAFVATKVQGNTTVSIQPDTALVLVTLPADAPMSLQGNKLFAGGRVIDYWNGNLDTDDDGLPDWWESLYFVSTTAALPQGTAANGFTHLQSYQLGLDPNSTATFRAEATLQPLTGMPQITWSSVGGKTYTVETSTDLALPGGGFTAIHTQAESDVPAGVANTETFVDIRDPADDPATSNGRFYRIRLATP